MSEWTLRKKYELSSDIKISEKVWTKSEAMPVGPGSFKKVVKLLKNWQPEKKICCIFLCTFPCLTSSPVPFNSAVIGWWRYLWASPLVSYDKFFTKNTQMFWLTITLQWSIFCDSDGDFRFLLGFTRTKYWYIIQPDWLIGTFLFVVHCGS